MFVRCLVSDFIRELFLLALCAVVLSFCCEQEPGDVVVS